MVELLIAIALFGVISIFFAVIVITNSNLFNSQKTNTHLANQNRIALDEMVNEVRESQTVASVCPNPPCGVSSTTGVAILVLQLWPLDTNGEPKDPSLGYDYIVYKRGADTTQLIKTVYPNPNSASTRPALTKIISADVNNLEFFYDTAPPATTAVTIHLVNQANSLNKTFTFEQTAKAVLRNK